MEDSVNILPLLWKFGLLFFSIFGIVFLIALLTPWLAKQVDRLRKRKGIPSTPPADDHLPTVRSIYDLPEQPPKDAPPAAENTHNEDYL